MFLSIISVLMALCKFTTRPRCIVVRPFTGDIEVIGQVFHHSEAQERSNHYITVPQHINLIDLESLNALK